MPYIVRGESGPRRSDIYNEVNHDYEYPNGLDLKPGSDFHNKLATKIWDRAREARNAISNRFDSWNKIDKNLTTYIPTSVKEKELKDKDSRKPISVVFPYTYSMLEALMTYMSMAFFQDPMFQYEGVEADDTQGAMLLEMVVRLHCIKTKVPLALHTIIRDSFAYGVGVGLPGWQRKMGRKPIKSVISAESDLGTSLTTETTWIDDLVFEGNDLSNIDPYMWLPDPSVSSDDIQSGEFQG